MNTSLSTQVLRNVRPMGGAAVDMLIRDARIESTLPAGTADTALPTLLDGGGQLLLPGLVEAHCHFDKTLWNMPWRPNSAGPTRWHRITNEHAVLRDEVQVPVAERAGPLIEHCIARGSLYFRSHLDAQTLFGLKHIESMLELRKRYAHLIDLQFVCFPQGGMLSAPGTVELMQQALELGVEVVGGIDPAVIDRDPVAAKVQRAPRNAVFDQRAGPVRHRHQNLVVQHRVFVGDAVPARGAGTVRPPGHVPERLVEVHVRLH